MADPTMDLAADLRKHIAAADPDLLRELVHSTVEALMSAEVDALNGAAWGERNSTRTNRRNGYRGRRWDTRVGTIDLKVLKLRASSNFPAWLLTPRRRAERALVNATFLSRAERAAYEAEPAAGSRFLGQAVHRATERALGPGWEYNAARGPDFRNLATGQVVELTTPGQLARHIARYGGEISYATYRLPGPR